MTLLELLEQDGIKMRRIGRTYRARCPFHNGKTNTSLSIDMEKGLYFCHGCGRTGDAIQWLRDFRGLSFQEACLELGREPMTKHSPTMCAIAHKPKPSLSLKWQEQAEAFLKGAVESLSENKEAVSFLHSRGLKPETIERASLGWNAVDCYEDRETWGLEPLQDEEGNVKRLWLPGGLVIPLRVAGAVLRLRIRRPSGDPRYYNLPGSDMRPMVWNIGRAAVVIVESELDGLLIDQEAGDMAEVLAIGSAQAKPDEDTDRVLKGASMVLIALDYDRAGASASWQYWLNTYPNARRWPTPYGKDPSEALQEGLNIRQWIEAGLLDQSHSERKESDQGAFKPFPREWLERYDTEQLERLAIQTICGGLSDSEAVRLLN